MVQTKIINDELCAVAFEASEIMIRKRGRAYFGEEKIIAKVLNDVLVVDKTTAEEYGLTVVTV